MINATILWDIENVTPKSGDQFISNLIEFLEEESNISSAICFGDWNKPVIRNISGKLFERNFELIHIPRSRKNSADISLITHATEMIFLYPHLQRFILITGDADFRPLLQTLKKHGKDVWIICDAANASEDLLALSNKYFDYRSIMTKDYEEDIDADDEGSGQTFSREAAFNLFYEAVAMMIREKKKPSSGAVKVKMKLLYEDFDELKLGYPNWKTFVKDALKKTSVVPDSVNSLLFTISEKEAEQSNIPEIFSHLLSTIDKNREWTSFASSQKLLRERKINIRDYGYNKFKKLVIDAEKRNLVEMKNEGSLWMFKSKS